MEGYSGRPLAAKLGIQPGWRVLVRNPPDGYRELLAELPEGVALGAYLAGRWRWSTCSPAPGPSWRPPSRSSPTHPPERHDLGLLAQALEVALGLLLAPLVDPLAVAEGGARTGALDAIALLLAHEPAGRRFRGLEVAVERAVAESEGDVDRRQLVEDLDGDLDDGECRADPDPGLLG